MPRPRPNGPMTIKSVNRASIDPSLRSVLERRTDLDSHTIEQTLDVLHEVMPDVMSAGIEGLLDQIVGQAGLGLTTCTGGHVCGSGFDSDTGSGDCQSESSCDVEACSANTCTDGHSCGSQGCGAQACDSAHSCGSHSSITQVTEHLAWQRFQRRMESATRRPEVLDNTHATFSQMQYPVL